MVEIIFLTLVGETRKGSKYFIEQSISFLGELLK